MVQNATENNTDFQLQRGGGGGREEGRGRRGETIILRQTDEREIGNGGEIKAKKIDRLNLKAEQLVVRK